VGACFSACEQDGHVDVARSEFELTLVLRSQGELVQAQALLTAVVRKEAVTFGERHLCVARSEHELAVVLRKKGSLDEARALLPAVVQKKVAALGDKHLDVARSQHELAMVLRGLGEPDNARAQLQLALSTVVGCKGNEDVQAVAIREAIVDLEEAPSRGRGGAGRPPRPCSCDAGEVWARGWWALWRPSTPRRYLGTSCG